MRQGLDGEGGLGIFFQHQNVDIVDKVVDGVENGRKTLCTCANFDLFPLWINCGNKENVHKPPLCKQIHPHM